MEVFRDLLGSGRNHHSYIYPPTYHLSDLNPTLNKETANSSEILVTTYMIAQCHTSEAHSLYFNFLQKPQISYPILFLSAQSNSTHWLILQFHSLQLFLFL
jgi:hypothetical protein